MHITTKALVLRGVDYKESDKILTLLTQDQGKLTAAARGCRKKGSAIAAGCQLLAGDLVQTSGLGGYYPSGLVIGTVEEVLVDDSGAASYAILAPKADLAALTEVFVIKDFDVVT